MTTIEELEDQLRKARKELFDVLAKHERLLREKHSLLRRRDRLLRTLELWRRKRSEEAK